VIRDPGYAKSFLPGVQAILFPPCYCNDSFPQRQCTRWWAVSLQILLFFVVFRSPAGFPSRSFVVEFFSPFPLLFLHDSLPLRVDVDIRRFRCQCPCFFLRVFFQVFFFFSFLFGPPCAIRSSSFDRGQPTDRKRNCLFPRFRQP